VGVAEVRVCLRLKKRKLLL